MRCDLNVPLDGKTITDDTRIRASIPTIEYLKKNGAKVLLSSHLGRPKDGPEDKFSLGPVAPRLSELLGTEVKLAPDCIGDGVKSCVDAMADGAGAERELVLGAILGATQVGRHLVCHDRQGWRRRGEVSPGATFSTSSPD